LSEYTNIKREKQFFYFQLIGKKNFNLQKKILICILINYEHNIHNNKKCLDLDWINKRNIIPWINSDKNKNKTNIINFTTNLHYNYKNNNHKLGNKLIYFLITKKKIHMKNGMLIMQIYDLLMFR